MVSDKKESSEFKYFLLEKCMNFVNNNQNNQNYNYSALIIEGKSGAGKSLFLISFLREINTLY